MKNIVLSASFILSAFVTTFMIQMPLTAMEMPELTITNRSGKPLTVDYTRASDQAGAESLGIDEKTAIQQFPSDSINTMVIKASGDSSIKPAELDPVDSIKLLEFPTSTITVTLNPQRKLEYTITTPGEKQPLEAVMPKFNKEEKAQPFEITELKSIQEVKARPSAKLNQEALSNSSSGKVVWEKAPKKENASITLIVEEGFKPVVRGEDVNITKIVNKSRMDITIIPSANILTFAVLGATNIQEISGGRTFLIGLEWPTPYYDLLSRGTGPVNLKVTHADSRIFIMIGKTIIHQLEEKAINQIHGKLGNNVMLT
ncbi:hypothetical protein H0W26_02490, partial [Candidatus Dependentiae bacterium]|nr:hypothetical protein [Candidatus Dependentiae bacterium]